jgi:hypothetical protein
MADEAIGNLKDSLLFCALQEDVFPCNASPIQAVSTGIAAGGLALLFTIWLTKKVNSNFSNGRRFGLPIGFLESGGLVGNLFCLFCDRKNMGVTCGILASTRNCLLSTVSLPLVVVVVVFEENVIKMQCLTPFRSASFGFAATVEASSSWQ